MKVAEPNKVSDWRFVLLNPSGEEVTVGPEANVYAIVNRVMSYISIYDTATNDEYSRKLKEQAAVVTDGDMAKYVKMLVEHQMCKIIKGRIKCWTGGVGDDVHDVLTKVEGFVVENAPIAVVNMVRRFAKTISGGKSSTVSGCASCGGTTVMNPAVNNLGRAGTLNRLLGKKQ